MNLKFKQTGTELIVYDADLIDQPAGMLFDPDYWIKRSAVRKVAKGRGGALVLDTDFGPAVLRAYRRGGWVRFVSFEHYLFTGFQRSRSVAEFNVLARLANQGLPVPQPLAGLCVRHGLTYTAAILTREIPLSETLADCLEQLDSNAPVWPGVGACIRKFHDAGVVHADLNARNILLSETEGRNVEIHLIDFDRALIGTPSRRASRNNLARLQRSLVKLWPASSKDGLARSWKRLIGGYNAASTTGSK